MKPVVQLEPTGCGIASVAAIAGVTYFRAKSVANSLGIFASDEALWSQTNHVRTLLRHFGLNAGRAEVRFRAWDTLPDLALLATKWHLEKGRPYWHWAVFVHEHGRCCVLDSRQGLNHNARTDFGRIRPRWYIHVTAAGEKLALHAQARNDPGNGQ